MIDDLFRVEFDPHRHALHDLDPVAAGVLRRQQRERAAGAQADAGQLAGVAHVVAVQVGGEFDRLAEAHLRELGFLEVRVHPHLFQRHHGYQRGAGLHALAELHAALGDVAGNRRDDRAALQIEIRLAQLRGRGLHLRLARERGVVDQRAVARQLAARGAERGFRGVELRACVREFLRRHRTAGDQSGATRDVGARLAHRDFARGEIGLACVDRVEQAAHLAHGGGEIRFRLFVRDLGVVRVELHQHLTGAHFHAVVGADADHGARGLRTDRDDIALHVGVVGVFVPAADHDVIGEERAAGDDQDRGQRQQRAAALAVLRRGRRWRDRCRRWKRTGSGVGGRTGMFGCHGATVEKAAGEEGAVPPPRATARSTATLRRCARSAASCVSSCSSGRWAPSTSSCVPRPAR